jgi:Domain of unknown function DUF29
MDRRSLYDDDIFAWAQQQAEALRRLAETRRDLPNELDLENVADEIQDVGKSELHETENLLTRLLVHLIKAHADPGSRARGHWLGEALTFQSQARRAFSPSMRRLIDLDDLWESAGRIAEAKLEVFGIESFPERPKACPFTLHELLADRLDVKEAVLRIGSPK